MTIRNGMPAAELDVTWRKSRRSGPQGGNCVEVAHLSDGQVAMRNSRFPGGPALVPQTADLIVTAEGLVIASDLNAGLSIMQFEGG